MLVALDRAAWVLALLAAWAAAGTMIAITGLILTEIVLRSFFATSTQILEEYVGYGLGAMVFLGLAHGLREGALVRVDVVLGRLGSDVRRWLEVVLCAITLAIMAFLLRYIGVGTWRNYERGTISMTLAATPVWIPEAVILAGMGIFTLTLSVYMLRLLAGGNVIAEGVARE